MRDDPWIVTEDDEGEKDAPVGRKRLAVDDVTEHVSVSNPTAVMTVTVDPVSDTVPPVMVETCCDPAVIEATTDCCVTAAVVAATASAPFWNVSKAPIGTGFCGAGPLSALAMMW